MSRRLAINTVAMDQNPTPGSDPAPPLPPPIIIPTPAAEIPIESAAPPVPPAPAPAPETFTAPPPTPPPVADPGIAGPPPVAGSAFSPHFSAGAPAVPLISSTKDERLWATLIHLGGLIGTWSAGLGLPGGNVLIPLILWLIKREGSAFINDQGKEVLNFQITITIVALGCFVLSFLCIGIPMLIALGVYSLAIGILGSIKANEGVAYRYPFTLRLIT